jgi:hypothetical protein
MTYALNYFHRSRQRRQLARDHYSLGNLAATRFGGAKTAEETAAVLEPDRAAVARFFVTLWGPAKALNEKRRGENPRRKI